MSLGKSKASTEELQHQVDLYERGPKNHVRAELEERGVELPMSLEEMKWK